MDSASIELPGSEVESVSLENGELRVKFSRAIIIKTMTGSAERTRWWQAGSLVMEGAEAHSDIPQGPLTCTGGDVVENVYTYRDMVPVPLESRGHTRCILSFEGIDEKLEVSGETVRLDMEATPRYLEHLRSE